MSADCIFCRIAKKEINADTVYEDDDVIAFKDLNPQAPVHLLIIPKKHIETLNDLDGRDLELAGRLILKTKEIAVDAGLGEDGYRLVINCNRNAGQEVFHIHLHLMGGRKFNWPPG